MKVRFRQDGPVVLDVPQDTPFILNGEGKRLERPKLALCRCRASGTKPLCDGTHKRTGFRAEAGTLELDLEHVVQSNQFIDGER
jgi:CDGSH iron-sulfur domain-containing protein 3